MRGINKQLMKTAGADVLSSRKNFKKTWGGGGGGGAGDGGIWQLPLVVRPSLNTPEDTGHVGNMLSLLFLHRLTYHSRMLVRSTP